METTINHLSRKTLENVNRAIDSNLFSKAQIAVRKNNITYEKSFNCKKTDLFDLASITKFFTNFWLLETLNKNKISIHEPIGNILKKFSMKRSRSKITFEHLLTFTVDFKFSMDDKNMKYLNDVEMYNSFWEEIYSAPLRNEPGSYFRYSNIASILAAKAITELSGKGIYQNKLNKLISPYELDIIGPTWNSVGSISSGHCDIRGDLSGQINDPTTVLLKQKGAAGMFSSAQGLVHLVEYASKKFIEYGYAPRNYLNEDTVGVRTGFGMGYDILGKNFTKFSELNTKAMYFSGFTGGHIVAVPEEDLYITVLTNVPTKNGMREPWRTGLLSPFRRSVTESLFSDFRN